MLILIAIAWIALGMISLYICTREADYEYVDTLDVITFALLGGVVFIAILAINLFCWPVWSLLRKPLWRKDK